MIDEGPPSPCACTRAPTRMLAPMPPTPPRVDYSLRSQLRLFSMHLPVHCALSRPLGFRPRVMDTSDAALTIIRFRGSLPRRRCMPMHRRPFHGLPQFRKLQFNWFRSTPDIPTLSPGASPGFHHPEGSKVNDYDWNRVSVTAGVSALEPCQSFQNAPFLTRCNYR